MGKLENIKMMENIGAVKSQCGFHIFFNTDDGGVTIFYDKDEDIFTIEIDSNSESNSYSKEGYEIHSFTTLFEFALQKLSDAKFEEGRNDKLEEIKSVLEIK